MSNRVIQRKKEQAAIRRRKQVITTVSYLGGALLLVLAVVFLLNNKKTAQVSGGPARIGQKIQDFSLTDIHGKTVHLSDYTGQVVLLNAWANWCPPCKAEMPDLNAYYQAHRQQGFVILAINAGDSASVAAAFAAEKGLSFPVLLDPTVSLLSRLGIRSYPTSILVGKDGVVKTIHVGMFSPVDLEAEITPYLLE